MSEEKKQPEKKEEEEVKNNIEDVKEIAPTGFKKLLNKFGYFVSNKLFTPSIITVFITAVLGPVAIKWVNDSIENKKLQKEVIQTVLTYTSEADFSKPESIEKIAIISQMVNENNEIFGLTFEKTNEQIRGLNEASNDAGIKNLNKKLNGAIKNINEHEAKLNTELDYLAELDQSREKLVAKLDRYTTYNKTKKKETENSISLIDIEIRDSEKQIEFNKERIKYWQNQKTIAEKDLDDATQDLSKMLEKNRNNEQMLEQEKDKLQEDLAKTLTDKQMLVNEVEELKMQLQVKDDSLKILNSKKEEK